MSHVLFPFTSRGNAWMLNIHEITFLNIYEITSSRSDAKYLNMAERLKYFKVQSQHSLSQKQHMISNRIHDNREIANKWSEGKIEACNKVFAKILILESETNQSGLVVAHCNATNPDNACKKSQDRKIREKKWNLFVLKQTYSRGCIICKMCPEAFLHRMKNEQRKRNPDTVDA